MEAIIDFPVPKSPRQLRRFIGMTNWYRGFIRNFSDLSGPLTNCLKKSNKPFRLDEDALNSFGKLKHALVTAPVLAQPNFSKEFVVQCDASQIGVGGVLLQCDEDGREHPLAFVSKKTQQGTAELYCDRVGKFRPYIEGLPFRIITDHSSLRWLMSQKDLCGRLARWSLQLQRYNFSIEHRKGSLNIVPDTLSRFDVDELGVGTFDGEVDLNAHNFDDDDYVTLRNTILNNRDALPDLRVEGKHVLKRVLLRRAIENEEPNLWRLWLPTSLVFSVIRKVHNHSSIHGGFMKTLAKIRQHFFWPTMSKDIKDFIATCDICKSIKPTNCVSRPPMGEAS